MNILFVTYYYRPLNVVASNRINSQIDAFQKNNNHVTVISRYWEDNKNESKNIFKATNKHQTKIKENLKEIYIPYKYYNLKISSNSVFYKILVYLGYITGNYCEVQNVKKNYLTHILNELKIKKYDLIIYSVNPFGFIPISKLIFKKTKVPYIIDFRDLISAKFIKKETTFFMNLIKKILFFNLRRQLKFVQFLTTVSDPIANLLRTISRKKTYIIYNGFNEELININENKTLNQKFTIGYLGNFYLQLNYKPLFIGLEKWYLENKEINFEIHFIGTSEDIVNKIKQDHPKLPILHTKWLPYSEGLILAKKADVLFNQSWTEHIGILGGKLFDYIGLKKNILVYPGVQNGDMEKLILKLNSGFIPENENELINQLNKWYLEKQKNGSIKINSIEKKIMLYSRANQNNKFTKIIQNIPKN